MKMTPAAEAHIRRVIAGGHAAGLGNDLPIVLLEEIDATRAELAALRAEVALREEAATYAASVGWRKSGGENWCCTETGEPRVWKTQEPDGRLRIPRCWSTVGTSQTYATDLLAILAHKPRPASIVVESRNVGVRNANDDGWDIPVLGPGVTAFSPGFLRGGGADKPGTYEGAIGILTRALALGVNDEPDPTLMRLRMAAHEALVFLESQRKPDPILEDLNAAMDEHSLAITMHERVRIIELLRAFSSWVSCPCSECRVTAASCGIDTEASVLAMIADIDKGE